jgi:hypothetical protein
MPDFATRVRNWSPSRTKRAVSSARGPFVAPSRLVSINSKSKIATRRPRACADCGHATRTQKMPKSPKSMRAMRPSLPLRGKITRHDKFGLLRSRDRAAPSQRCRERLVPRYPISRLRAAGAVRRSSLPAEARKRNIETVIWICEDCSRPDRRESAELKENLSHGSASGGTAGARTSRY